jgi:hypothetical protein
MTMDSPIENSHLPTDSNLQISSQHLRKGWRLKMRRVVIYSLK